MWSCSCIKSSVKDFIRKWRERGGKMWIHFQQLAKRDPFSHSAGAHQRPDPIVTLRGADSAASDQHLKTTVVNLWWRRPLELSDAAEWPCSYEIFSSEMTWPPSSRAAAPLLTTAVWCWGQRTGWVLCAAAAVCVCTQVSDTLCDRVWLWPPGTHIWSGDRKVTETKRLSPPITVVLFAQCSLRCLVSPVFPHVDGFEAWRKLTKGVQDSESWREYKEMFLAAD